MTREQTIAHDLLSIGAVFLRPDEPFTWASGIKSPIYCDNRLTLTAPEVRTHVEEGLVDLVCKHYPNVEVLMGTSTAGIAHAAIVGHLMGLPMGYVRSSGKDHGRQNRIEGKLEPGQRVVVVEDLISTGGSCIDVVEALREAGAEVLGIASIFVCIMLLTNSIMQAHGKVKLPIYTMILGGVVKVAINYMLVGNPDINIKGAPIGTLACYGLVALVNLVIVHRLLEEKPNYFFIFSKPVIASAAMGAAAWASHGLLSGVIGGSYMKNSLCTLCAVGIAVVVYLILVIALRMITKADLKMIPHGDKLAKLLHVR